MNISSTALNPSQVALIFTSVQHSFYFMNALIQFCYRLNVVLVTGLLFCVCLRVLGGGIHHKFTLSDLWLWWVFALIFTAIGLLGGPVLNIIALCLLLIIVILQWANAVMTRQFGIKLNWHALGLFFSGPGQFTGEASETLREFLANVKLPLLLILFLPLFYFAVRANYFYWAINLATVMSYAIACRTKSKVNQGTWYYWAVLAAIFSLLAFYAYHHLIWELVNPVISAILLALLVLGYIAKIFFRSNFLRQRNVFATQFQDQRIYSDQISQITESISTDDQRLVQLNYQQPQKSELFASCHGANIVIVTLESVAQDAVAYYGGQANMPLFESFIETGLSSQRHICQSPFTNNALSAIYKSDYPQQKNFPFLQHLKNQGYQTAFVSSQKTDEFKLKQLLAEISFDTVIDNYSITGKRHKTLRDAEFFPQALDHFKASYKAGQPLMLHIMNNQTHGPYFTEQPIQDRKQRYLQSIQEADQQVKRILDELSSFLDMENTIVVYTADHGESFAEDGYLSHSNSIINQQTLVPFAIKHKNLVKKSRTHSSHFDIWPTLMGLLGLEVEQPCLGQSLLLPAQDLNMLLYSETRCGNTPASFGALHGDQKIYFDRYYQHYQMRDLDDNVLYEFNEAQKNYYLKVLYQALQVRDLLY